jgi:MFS superfamily sulfate permease-like transporter
MGVALTVISSQLEKIFGFKVQGSGFFTITWRIITHLGDTQVLTLVLGVGLIVVSVALQRFAPRVRPDPGEPVEEINLAHRLASDPFDDRADRPPRDTHQLSHRGL